MGYTEGKIGPMKSREHQLETRRRYSHSAKAQERRKRERPVMRIKQGIWYKTMKIIKPEEMRYWVRSYRRRIKYGMTISEHSRLLTMQGGLCAICRDSNYDKDRLFVDHNHETGRVRGLLCLKCNTALGMTKEDPFVLMNMIEYLAIHQ